jgi:hypothetical protein
VIYFLDACVLARNGVRCAVELHRRPGATRKMDSRKKQLSRAKRAPLPSTDRTKVPSAGEAGAAVPGVASYIVVQVSRANL